MASRYWRAQVRRQCVECGAWLLLDSRASYCGTACRSAAYRRRLRQRSGPDLPRYVMSSYDVSQLCDTDGVGSIASEPPTAAVRTAPDLVGFSEGRPAGLDDLHGATPLRALSEVPLEDIRRFYTDLLHELGEHARRGGTATGAAAVAKSVALRHGVPGATELPVPRLNRAEREELGVDGASWRRARGVRRGR